jgi:hypothetical protein
MEHMLSRALRDFLSGPLNQLIVNLAGRDAVRWEEQFGLFLRQEPCWRDRKTCIKESTGGRITLSSEIVLRGFTFASCSLYRDPGVDFQELFVQPMPHASAYACKDYILVGYRVQPEEWDVILARLEGGNRTAIFTDIEELRAIIASLVIQQTLGQTSLLTWREANRFLFKHHGYAKTAIVAWRENTGWNVGVEDGHSCHPGHNYIVRV